MSNNDKDKDKDETETPKVMLAVQPPRLKILKTLLPEDVANFLPTFLHAESEFLESTGKTLSVLGYLTGDVINDLQYIHQAMKGDEVLKVLKTIKRKRESDRKADAFHHFKATLIWDRSSPTLERAVDKFFQDILREMSGSSTWRKV